MFSTVEEESGFPNLVAAVASAICPMMQCGSWKFMIQY